MGLSQRLMLLVLVAVIPLAIVQATAQFDLRRSREAETRAAVQQAAEHIAADEQRVIEGARQLLQTLVELNEIRNRDVKACAALLDSIQPHFQAFEAFAVTDAGGRVFCATHAQGQPVAVSLGDRTYFTEAMRTGSFAVGEYSVGRFTQKQVVSFALPYLDRAGERGGVVAVSVDLAWFANEVGGPEWNGEQAMTIADRNGRILVRLPNDGNYVGQQMPPETWAFAGTLTAPTSRDITSSLDGRTRIVGLVPPNAGPGGFLVAAGVSREAAFHDLEVAEQRSWLGTGIVTLGSLALAWLFGQRLIRTPIARLIMTTRKWRGGEYGARAGMSGSSEIHELGRSFDEMADALEEALQHKDMLLRELSHRVMNSLQTIAALFRLQARQVKDPQARAQFANAVTRINSVALAYRRMQAEDGVELVDFAAFLRELCADLHRSLMPDSAPCDVQADPVMLGTDQAMPLALIVNELIANALKHGAPDQPVTVLLGRSTEFCRLAVRNGGALPPGYDPAATTGFGMQMVNLIVKQLNGKLEASTMGGQTEFAVSFIPIAPQPTILTVISGAQRDTAAGFADAP